MNTMKWSLQQLFKYGKNPFPVEGTFHYDDEIKDIDDILDITPAVVLGSGVRVADESYRFNLHISVILYLQDAVTLDPVMFPLELDVVEVFGREYDEEHDTRVIEKNTIELRSVVWESILLEKPIRYVKKETQ